MTRSMSSGGEHSMWTWESKLGHPKFWHVRYNIGKWMVETPHWSSLRVYRWSITKGLELIAVLFFQIEDMCNKKEKSHDLDLDTSILCWELLRWSENGDPLFIHNGVGLFKCKKRKHQSLPYPEFALVKCIYRIKKASANRFKVKPLMQKRTKKQTTHINPPLMTQYSPSLFVV